MPRGRKPIRKQQVKDWLDRQDDPDAWLTKTYKQIGMELIPDEIIDPATIRGVLCMVIADRDNVLPSEVLKRKAEYRKHVEGFFTAEKLKMLKEWRTQNPPVEVVDCAYRLDISLSQVTKKCKELGI